jgi:hypothetical protein
MQFKQIINGFIFAAFILTFNQLNAQMYQKGQQDLHLGVGLGTTLYGGGYRSILPPLNVSYEKGITENIGVGAYLGYASSRYDYDGFANLDYHWRYNYVILGARGAYHYDLFKKPKLDTYGGLMLGFTFANARFHSDDPTIDEANYSSPASGGITWSGFLGARYQFKPKLGAYAELGYGVSWLNLGLRMKL